MRAMILAAGRGERLRPLTDTCPKPLIKVGGIALAVRHIHKLKAAGIQEIVVNSAWLSDKIVAVLGDGSTFGVHIIHSVEVPGGLETAGGIVQALPYLGDEVFLVVNGDTLIDCDYAKLTQIKLPDNALAHLFLVRNPEHHPQGDFSLNERSAIMAGGAYTFSGAALYRPAAFAGLKPQRMPLRPLLDSWLAQGQLQGSVLPGAWFDVGTAERLQQAEAYLQRASQDGSNTGSFDL